MSLYSVDWISLIFHASFNIAENFGRRPPNVPRRGNVGFAPAAQGLHNQNPPLRGRVDTQVRHVLPQGHPHYRLGNVGILEPLVTVFQNMDFSGWTPEQVLEFQRNFINSRNPISSANTNTNNNQNLQGVPKNNQNH